VFLILNFSLPANVPYTPTVYLIFKYFTGQNSRQAALFKLFTFARSHTVHISQGKTRAKQHFSGDTERKRCLSVVLHGDAAFAGQVNECIVVCCSEW